MCAKNYCIVTFAAVKCAGNNTRLFILSGGLCNTNTHHSFIYRKHVFI